MELNILIYNRNLRLSAHVFGHFVSYMLMLGHKNMQAYFCDTRYRMFHVKHVHDLEGLFDWN